MGALIVPSTLGDFPARALACCFVWRVCGWTGVRRCCDSVVAHDDSYSGCVHDHGLVYELDVEGWIGHEEPVEASELRD